ncbi:MAG: hypothetical protein J6V44_03530 [Methanobrevibacter sp.]|nr:hypothetical protein [Methanobrevibacter sp.]
MDYLIGYNHEILFELTQVGKLYISEEEDTIEIYDETKKKRIFYCGKDACDFIIVWEAGEPIPATLKKIYGVPESTEDDTEEPTEPEEPTPEEPTPEEPA